MFSYLHIVSFWFQHIILLAESEYQKPSCYCWAWDCFYASTVWVMLWFLCLCFIPDLQHLEVLFTFLFWTPFWDFYTLALKFTGNSWSKASFVDPVIYVYVLFLWLLFLLWFSSIPVDCPWCASSGALPPRWGCSDLLDNIPLIRGAVKIKEIWISCKMLWEEG